MASILSLGKVKELLSLEADDDTYDDTAPRPSMEAMLELVTSWFEGYCDRGLAFRVITDEEVFFNDVYRIYVWCFPITALTDVTVDAGVQLGTYYEFSKHGGYFFAKGSGYYRPPIERSQKIVISYSGGYTDETCPADLAFAFANAVGVQSGVTGVVASTSNVAATSSSSGGAIKSIGLGGGALAVQFDTANVSSGTKGTYDVSNVPSELQPYASVLDRYVRVRV